MHTEDKPNLAMESIQPCLVVASLKHQRASISLLVVTIASLKHQCADRSP